MKALRIHLGTLGLCTLLLLAGCGQKGPLYLPDDEGTPSEAAEPSDDTASS